MKKIFETFQSEHKFTHLNYLTSQEIEKYPDYSEKSGFRTAQAYSYRMDLPMENVGRDVSSDRFKDFSIPFQMIPQLSDYEIKNWYTKEFKSNRPCHFIWHSTYLYPDGTLKSCHFLQEPFGNIREQSIKKSGIVLNIRISGLKSKLKCLQRVRDAVSCRQYT